MKQTKWFDRKFDFSFDQNIFPSIIERLEGTPLRLDHKVDGIPSVQLTSKPDNKWSINENVGHLIDLEPIWHGRLEDILNGEEYLRSADLENTKTHLADHNRREIKSLIKEFVSVRKATIDKLRKISEKEVYQSALHPRLKTPMRTMDLFLFVAEHDDHHLAQISNIIKQLS